MKRRWMPARRKRAADSFRVLLRRFLRQLRHGDFDEILPAFEALFKATERK